jgi:acyl-homoserine-lactone acylase
VVTVNGERARFFGPEQSTLEERNNLASDVFFSWLNTPEAVAVLEGPESADPAAYRRLCGRL